MQTLVVSNPADVRASAGAVSNIVVKNNVPVQEPKAQKHEIHNHEVAKLQTALAQHDISLKFSKDEATNDLVVELIDQKTGEAIRQFPTEVSLSLAATFQKLQGVFVDVAE